MIWETGLNMLQGKRAYVPRCDIPDDRPIEPCFSEPSNRKEICAKATAASVANRKMAKQVSKTKVYEAVKQAELNCIEVAKRTGLVKGYAYNLLLELVSEGKVTRSKIHDWHYYKAV